MSGEELRKHGNIHYEGKGMLTNHANQACFNLLACQQLLTALLPGKC